MPCCCWGWCTCCFQTTWSLPFVLIIWCFPTCFPIIPPFSLLESRVLHSWPKTLPWISKFWWWVKLPIWNPHSLRMFGESHATNQRPWRHLHRHVGPRQPGNPTVVPRSKSWMGFPIAGWFHGNIWRWMEFFFLLGKSLLLGDANHAMFDGWHPQTRLRWNPTAPSRLLAAK